MGKRKNKDLNNDFVCDTCGKEFETMWQFTVYGNEKRKEEYFKGAKYCGKHFEEKKNKLDHNSE